MLRAIIFDFNGVILNDEPLHCRSLCESAAEAGIVVSEREYWDKYLPLDDESCLRAICDDRNIQLTPDRRLRVMERKRELYSRLLSNRLPLFPGVTTFIPQAAAAFPLALASGARRCEIVSALEAAGLKSCFHVIVGAEDFVRGKPHPDSYLLALSLLNACLNGRSSPVLPGECLVIEDSVHGVQGALAAGMKCMAVTNTYPRGELSAADLIVASLEEVSPESLSGLFKEHS